MANIAQSVDVVATLRTAPASSARPSGGQCCSSAATYDGHTSPEWGRSAADMPRLDVSCALDEEQGIANLLVVNRDLDRHLPVQLPADHSAPSNAEV